MKRFQLILIVTVFVSGWFFYPAAQDLDHQCALPGAYFEAVKDLEISSHGDFAKRHFPKRMNDFSEAPLGCHQIIMLGDSLTEMNNWSLTLPSQKRIRNRGIGGDTSDGVRTRLEEVIVSQPKAVFLLIGTNDLWIDRAAEVTAGNILATARDIKSQSPKTKVFVQTVFPTRFSDELNQRVVDINEMLKSNIKGESITLIDTYSLVVDSEGLLRNDYTFDDLHLTGKGNRAWADLVLETLREHDLAG